jgi:hypothetical protein
MGPVLSQGQEQGGYCVVNSSVSEQKISVEFTKSELEIIQREVQGWCDDYEYTQCDERRIRSIILKCETALAILEQAEEPTR